MAEKSVGQRDAEALIGRQIAAGGPFVAAVAATRMPMLVTDARLPDHPIIFANGAFLRLTGYTLEDLLGRTHRVLNGPETDAGAVEPLEDAFRAAHDVKVETVLYRKDGTAFRAALFIAPIHDHEGQLVQHLASYLDVTDLRAAEAGLRRANAELERRVRERTEQLQRALDDREVLLQEVNHRVKNSLQLAAAILHLQAKAQTDTAARDDLLQAESRLASLARIHGLLHRSGDVQDTDLGSYLRGLCDDLLFSTVKEPDRIAARVEVDDLRWGANRIIPLGMIVNELVTNALKHAFPNGRRGTIRVRLERDGGTARLTVSDNGVGLPAGDGDRRSLGLRLVRRFAEQLGGTLKVENGPGSTFIVSFPA